MIIVSDSEKDDFRSLITGAGFSVADFELHEMRDPPQSVVYPVRGRVSIERKSTRAVREYAAGHMTAWLAEFDRDLRGGAFGQLTGRGDR